MLKKKTHGMPLNICVLACMAGMFATFTWAEEHEGREGREKHEGRESREHGSKSSRTPYKVMPPAAKQAIDYEKDVRPILMENCTRCHGAKKQKGDLRLDNKESILAGGEDGAVITPGNSVKSVLIQSVCGIGIESEKIMPPKDDLLTKEEIGILRAWVDQGAKFAK